MWTWVRILLCSHRWSNRYELPDGTPGVMSLPGVYRVWRCSKCPKVVRHRQLPIPARPPSQWSPQEMPSHLSEVSPFAKGEIARCGNADLRPLYASRAIEKARNIILHMGAHEMRGNAATPYYKFSDTGHFRELREAIAALDAVNAGHKAWDEV